MLAIWHLILRKNKLLKHPINQALVIDEFGVVGDSHFLNTNAMILGANTEFGA